MSDGVFDDRCIALIDETHRCACAFPFGRRTYGIFTRSAGARTPSNNQVADVTVGVRLDDPSGHATAVAENVSQSAWPGRRGVGEAPAARRQAAWGGRNEHMGSTRIQRVARTRFGGERAGRTGRPRGDRRRGRREVPQRGTAHPAGLRARLPGGGAAARRAGEPVRDRAVRVRGEHLRRGHRDGAGGRDLPADPSDQAGSARPRGRARHPQGIPARSGRRPPRRCRAPRLQAGERAGRTGRVVQARRLRNRGGLGHQCRRGRNPVLHGP